MTDKERLLIHRDGNPDCPACQTNRVHTREELGPPLHPLAGHGYAAETGWTHPDLVPAAVAKYKPTEVSL